MMLSLWAKGRAQREPHITSVPRHGHGHARARPCSRSRCTMAPGAYLDYLP